MVIFFFRFPVINTWLSHYGISEMPRRNWNIYNSLIGTFHRGTPKGLVSIRYSDGSVYEGPYLHEMWLNDIGQVRPEGRERNHFGMYMCADGRTFEGHNVDNHFDCMNLQVRN